MTTRPEASCDNGPDWRAMHRAILDQANALFAEHGYGVTTMKELAARCDCSVGYLYKHFSGKQEILDVLLAEHLDVVEEVRATVRRDPARPALDRLETELDEICRHLVAHRALIPVYAQREMEAAPAIRRRVASLRERDAELLAQARREGALPDVDTTLLAAVLSGAVDGLFKHLARDGDDAAFLSIPRIIDEVILDPLRRRAPAAAESSGT